MTQASVSDRGEPHLFGPMSQSTFTLGRPHHDHWSFLTSRQLSAGKTACKQAVIEGMRFRTKALLIFEFVLSFSGDRGSEIASTKIRGAGVEQPGIGTVWVGFIEPSQAG